MILKRVRLIVTYRPKSLLTDLLNASRRLDISFSSAGGDLINERNTKTSSKNVTQVKVIESIVRDYKAGFILRISDGYLTGAPVHSHSSSYKHMSSWSSVDSIVCKKMWTNNLWNLYWKITRSISKLYLFYDQLLRQKDISFFLYNKSFLFLSFIFLANRLIWTSLIDYFVRVQHCTVLCLRLTAECAIWM